MAVLFGKRRKIVRAAVRGLACGAAAVGALRLWGPGWLPAVVPSLSPFTALLAVAAGAGVVLLLAAVPVAVVSLFRPRFFCRWICPAGSCQDAVSFWVPRWAWVGRVPQLGVWIVFVGLGASLMGYPLFGCLDPLVMFNAAFAVAQPHPGGWDAAAAAGAGALLVLALAAPGLWCGRLCPLGAVQDLLRATARAFGGGRPPPKGNEATKTAGAAASRRVFMGLGLGIGYRLALAPGKEARSRMIRPPATGAEARFTRLCVRCGNCVRACPGGIIRFGGTGSGLAGILAPEVCFEDDYCPVSCTACGQVCPTGAIPCFTRADKAREPMGLARVDTETCLLGAGRECGTCAQACPHEALDLAWDPVEMVSRVIVKTKVCTGCGYCEYVCPTTPKTIRVTAIRKGGV